MKTLKATTRPIFNETDPSEDLDLDLQLTFLILKTRPARTDSTMAGVPPSSLSSMLSWKRRVSRVTCQVTLHVNITSTIVYDNKFTCILHGLALVKTKRNVQGSRA